MTKFRLWLGEWLHILADKVLPIPAYAKGGTHVGTVGDYMLVSSAVVLEGSDIYERSLECGVSLDDGRAVMVEEAKTEVLRRVLPVVAENVSWSVVTHGSRRRVYYEVIGRSVIKKIGKCAERTHT